MSGRAQSNADFEAALEAARAYEKAVAAWLQRRGWKVLPTYDFSGKGDAKAPKHPTCDRVRARRHAEEGTLLAGREKARA